MQHKMPLLWKEGNAVRAEKGAGSVLLLKPRSSAAQPASGTLRKAWAASGLAHFLPWAITQFTQHRREGHTIHNKKKTYFGITAERTPGLLGGLLSAAHHQLEARAGGR